MKAGDKYIIEIERNCIKFLQDSGWMEKHDDAIYQKGLRHGCSYLSEDDCIKFLKSSGWLEKHDLCVEMFGRGFSAGRKSLTEE